ncbi:hypothetical protein Tco_0475996 [Tanacetum coccineum]
MLYEREHKWINDFVPMDSDMVKDSGKKDDDSQKQAESNKKRPRAEHDEESVKKQKLEDDAEKEELKACLDIALGDDIVINIFGEMLEDFDRQNVVDLYKLVKERYETISLEGYDRLLWGDLITLFESSEEDEIWKAMDNVEGDTINVGGAVNSATTRVSAPSASVTTGGVSISTAEPRTPPTTITTAFEDKDLTIAQTLVKMRSQMDKEKGKGVSFRATQEESTRLTRILSTARTIRILPTIDPKDKGKGIIQEPKKPPKNPRKAQIQMDEELAMRLHEEEKAALEKNVKG